MSLHPKIKSHLESLTARKPGVTPAVEQQRNALNSLIVPLEDRPAIHSVEDRIIPGEEYDIPIRIYTPKEVGPHPLLVFFHGGGFFMGSIETHDVKVRNIAIASGYKVISVDYRLAPEHPFPSAVNDCYAATKWVAEHVDELDGDATRLAVGGDSAGGNLATVVALKARDENGPMISKQVLIYPSTDFDSDASLYPSLEENGRGYGLERGDMPLVTHYYLNDLENIDNPYASPIRADVSGLPPAFIITAEYDPLRDEGERYADKLAKAGVEVELKRYDGAIHGFLRHFTELEEYKDVYNLIGKFLNKG